jgi:nitrate/nitrite-specific signal transduction histidine kinase/Na+-transporting methylmalonyl-CoA/oxaloacetate decarboxylase gamma subunit
MLSLLALFRKSPPASGSGIELHEDASTKFTGRIDRKLSFVFIFLFILVLVVGGTSFYLLRSHLLKSDVVARQSEQVQFVEQIDSRLQSFTAEIQLAQLQGRAIPDSLIKTSSKDFDTLLTLYKKSGGEARNIQEMQEMIADAEGVAARIVSRTQNGLGRPESEVNIRDLEVMESIQHRIQVFADRISMEHESIEARLVSETRRKMRMTMEFNVALVLIGTLFLLASKRYFHRAIVLPLRRLAERSSEIAKGDLSKSVPVTSTDEIGRLSHAFNRMAAQLKVHEEKSKRLAIVEERERLASELHDNLAQDLAFLRIKLIDAERNLHGNSSFGAKQLLKELFPIVDEAYQDLREAIFGLRALASRNDVGLVAALADFLRDFSEVRNISVDLKVDHPEVLDFSSQVEIQLIRIIHEALTNIVKHAHATKGKITIENDKDTAVITIEDDGKGFCESKSSKPSLHFGVQTMKDRAESVGGKLAVWSSPGRGTRVTIQLPLVKPNSDENHSLVAR